MSMLFATAQRDLFPKPGVMGGLFIQSAISSSRQTLAPLSGLSPIKGLSPLLRIAPEILRRGVQFNLRSKGYPQ
jgi:hypothetical protein